MLSKVRLLEEERLKEGIEEESLTLMQRFRLWLVRSRKESSEVVSIDKQGSVEVPDEPKVDLNNNQKSTDEP